MDARKIAIAGESVLAVLLLTFAGVFVACQNQAGQAGPAFVAPLPPVITEPAADGQLVSAADVHMETRPMQDADAGSEHVCTDWEIWTAQPHERVWFGDCIGGVQKTHAHLGDGDFVNAFVDRHDLLPDRDYELRVRHKDSSGDPATEWSEYTVRPFRTDKERKPLPGAKQWLVKQPGYKVEEVATGLSLPVNLAMVPEHNVSPGKPMFYVTELYGTIKVVRGDFTVSTYAKDLLNFDPRGNFPGAGEIGLTGIVVEPKTGDVFASMLYKSGAQTYPKVVRFHSTDGGFTAATATTVIEMKGESQEASHQISNLTIGPDGKLYVHMGDGFTPSSARKLDSMRGKILRMNLDGTAPEDNPFYNAADNKKARDFIWASGFRNPFGGAWRAADGQHYSVENGPSSNDRFARVVKGADYGWDVTGESLRKRALYNWPITHAPVNIAFVQSENYQSAGFPKEKFGHAYVSESGPTFASGPQERGKRIVEFTFNGNGTVGAPKTLVEYNGFGKTSVAGLVAGPDALYFTGLYAEDSFDPAAPLAKIYRVRYVGGDTGNHPAGSKAECTDGDLLVTARAGKTELAKGVGTSLTLVIKNSSKQACSRDVGADMQELFITHGTDKVWSSDDCGAPRGHQVMNLAAGRELVVTVGWNGKSSSACVKGALRVAAGPVFKPGEYTLYGRVGSDRSMPVKIKVK
ncbi:PQQ-dependent sugar dehydrogenase [Catellatospora tritici]|uniref:PQQ-dependent sugar dehydrogenase n=1 Tax=Catellatospora tritici TaxID=2851566 RepID=UPI001C2CF92E|nr:PQQ-dependent sugar dehydrogenase [Catellatospora tritici]MBV1854661.1 PQQ-dependent sugar dehydrogenase [Catellatospora tritici]